MAAETASRLQELFEERTNSQLRSIVRYDQDTYEIEYLRNDVSAQYSDEKLQKAINESRMDSLSTPIYEKAFAEDHGDMTCLVQCFENVIEMNFIVRDGVGVAVGLDAEAMSESHGLIGDAYDIIITERDR